jgi:2,4-diketo-3-deoxy-L-fuconate hydrolase
MKLMRCGAPGQERPAILDDLGCARDLSAHVADISGKTLLPASLERLRSINLESLPLIKSAVRLGACIGSVGKIVGIGLNYADHAAEANMPVPTEPPLFIKPSSAIVGPNDDVEIPRGSEKTDWEVELGVVIGKSAKYVTREVAMEHVAGYCIVNDLSERAYQLERGGQWDKGKGCDTFGPVGPWLVTPDEVGDPQNLGMFLNLNGRRMQTGHTRNMIFSVARLIAYVSEFMTLYPGDLLTTGTPAGVGMGQKPAPIFLKPGDRLHLGIDKLGEQNQNVVAWRHLGETVLA